VEHFIFNGADLMWPGIYRVELTQSPEILELVFKQDQLCVIYAFNGKIDSEDPTNPKKIRQYCPVATGRMLNKGEILNSEPRQGLPQKGKAVFIDHYLYDELWNMGSRKIPQ
jgi:predicted ribosome-associated RNA-binding protein Tma20